MLAFERLEQLSQELMRALRAGKSQREFSQQLGFTSNVAYAWESGRRFPEASVFLKAAGAGKLEFRQPFLKLIGEQGALDELRWGTPHLVRRILEQLVGDSSNADISEQANVDRNTLSRWLRGQTEPRLPDFLRLVEMGTQRLFEVVALIADPSTLSSTRDAYRDLRLQQKLAYDLPWSHALLRALELSSYRRATEHSVDTLAASVGLSPRRTLRYLKELESAGQIQFTGTHYEATRIMTVDTRVDPRGNAKLKRHWARVALRRLEEQATSPESFFSYNLFSADETTFQRIRQLHLEYYERVRTLLDKAPGTDRVVLMNQQLLPLAKCES